MSNIVCCIIFGFFIILGVVDVIKFIILNIFNFSKHSDEKLLSQKTLLPAKVDSENIEYIIRSILIQNAWGKNSDEAELLPRNISEETHKIFNILCEDYPNLKTENHASTIKA